MGGACSSYTPAAAIVGDASKRTLDKVVHGCLILREPGVGAYTPASLLATRWLSTSSYAAATDKIEATVVKLKLTRRIVN